ncbi:MAG: hypothetical protein HYS41_06070 [Candidatus Omnitrophica bacterium]|nr:hypothetical protein [Candidatus Omnitrophota bacterium]
MKQTLAFLLALTFGLGPTPAHALRQQAAGGEELTAHLAGLEELEGLLEQLADEDTWKQPDTVHGIVLQLRQMTRPIPKSYALTALIERHGLTTIADDPLLLKGLRLQPRETACLRALGVILKMLERSPRDVNAAKALATLQEPFAIPALEGAKERLAPPYSNGGDRGGTMATPTGGTVNWSTPSHTVDRDRIPRQQIEKSIAALQVIGQARETYDLRDGTAELVPIQEAISQHGFDLWVDLELLKEESQIERLRAANIEIHPLQPTSLPRQRFGLIIAWARTRIRLDPKSAPVLWLKDKASLRELTPEFLKVVAAQLNQGRQIWWVPASSNARFWEGEGEEPEAHLYLYHQV